MSLVFNDPTVTDASVTQPRIYNEDDFASFHGGPNDQRGWGGKHHMPLLDPALTYTVPGLDSWFASDAWAYGVEPAPRTVLDLGSHHGYAAVDYLLRWPDCIVVAVDADPDNAQKTRGQTASSRLLVVNAAVTTVNGQVRWQPGLHSMTGRIDGDGPVWVEAITMTAALDWLDDEVDFVKMDIEGAERPILKAAAAEGWAERVRSIRIDLHGYDARECADDLRALGFRVVAIPWFESIYATRWPEPF